MPFVPAICPQCGDRIKVDDSLKTGKCPSCGCEFVMEQAITSYNNYVTNNVNNTIESAVFSNHDTIDELIERFNANLKLVNFEKEEIFDSIADYAGDYGFFKGFAWAYKKSDSAKSLQLLFDKYVTNNQYMLQMTSIVENMKTLYPHVGTVYLYSYYLSVLNYYFACRCANTVLDAALNFDDFENEMSTETSNELYAELQGVDWYRQKAQGLMITYSSIYHDNHNKCYKFYPEIINKNFDIIEHIKSLSGDIESMTDDIENKITDYRNKVEIYANKKADMEKCEAKKNKRKSRLKMFLFFFIVPVFAILSIVLAATVDGIVTTILGVIGILVLIGYAGAIWGLIKHK